jgi:hypothetical protein
MRHDQVNTLFMVNLEARVLFGNQFANYRVVKRAVHI